MWIRKRKAEKAQSEKLKRLLLVLSYTKISLVFFVAGCGLLLIFILKAGELGTHGIINYVYFVLLIPFALSASVFLFKVVNSKASFKGKVWGGVLELGGSAVVFVLILLLGSYLLPKMKPFDFTIVLADVQGKTVLKNQGEIKIILDNEIRTQKIDENGSVDLKNLPAPFKGKKVRIELDAPGWQFTNGKVTRFFVLKNSNAHMTVERDDSLCCISGTIVDEKGNFIAGAKVTIKGISTETNENGWFELRIPPEKQVLQQLLTVQMKGYKSYNSYVYPGNKSIIKISLTKIGRNYK